MVLLIGVDFSENVANKTGPIVDKGKLDSRSIGGKAKDVRNNSSDNRPVSC